MLQFTVSRAIKDARERWHHFMKLISLPCPLAEARLLRVIETIRVLGKGSLAPSDEWRSIRASVVSSLTKVVWPEGSADFAINPSRKQNGVKPITGLAAEHLKALGWELCVKWPIDESKSPADMDGAFRSSAGLVAFEWETGNIASAHRSMNKMCLGLYLGALAGGILAISSNNLAQYLTDRVGNIGELRRYVPLWTATPCHAGVLEILVVEYDRIDPSTPLIPKGKSGWAARSV